MTNDKYNGYTFEKKRTEIKNIGNKLRDIRVALVFTTKKFKSTDEAASKEQLIFIIKIKKFSLR